MSGASLATLAPRVDRRITALGAAAEVLSSHQTFSGLAEDTRADAVPSPDGKRIVYYDYNAGGERRGRLKAIGPDGGSVLISREEPDGNRRSICEWDASGQRLAYASQGGMLWVVDARTGRRQRMPRVVVPGEDIWSFRWSKDGDWLLVETSSWVQAGIDSTRVGRTLLACSPTTKEVIEVATLADEPSNDFSWMPSWAPGPVSLVFCEQPTPEGKRVVRHDLTTRASAPLLERAGPVEMSLQAVADDVPVVACELRADGSEDSTTDSLYCHDLRRDRLCEIPFPEGDTPLLRRAWLSPDGEVVAQDLHFRSGRQHLLAVTDLTGGQRTVIREPITDGEQLTSWQEPVWSPDSRHLAIVSKSHEQGRRPPQRARLTIADGRGCAQRAVFEAKEIRSPVLWSPSGRWVLVEATHTGEDERRLHVIDVEGEGGVLEFEGSDYRYPSFKPLGWSADESSLFYEVAEGRTTRIMRADLTFLRSFPVGPRTRKSSLAA